MSKVVLDSSALIALMLGEPGAEVVVRCLDGAVLSSVNLAEIGAKMVDKGASLELVETEIRAAGIQIVAFDETQAFGSARLRPLTKDADLSLADRACLALGATLDCPIVTADRPWAKLGLPLDIRLIR